MIADIETPRLALRHMSPAFLAASQRDDLVAAEAEVGLVVPKDWLAEKPLMAMRLQDMADDPAYAPWSVRAIGLRSEHWMVGHIGFHDPPREGGKLEMGYTVFPDFRRQGYATEAVLAMMGWATSVHGIRRFIASISPTNEPSLATVRRLGFVQTGAQWDEEDGEELVFELESPVA